MTLLPQRDSSPGRTPTVLDFSLLALSFQSGWAFTKVLSEERHLGDCTAELLSGVVWGRGTGFASGLQITAITQTGQAELLQGILFVPHD